MEHTIIFKKEELDSILKTRFKIKFNEVFIKPFNDINNLVKEENNDFSALVWAITGIILFICITLLAIPVLLPYTILSSIKLNKKRR